MSDGQAIFKVGTRGSALALVQAEMTESALREKFSQLEYQRVVIKTIGDKRTDVPLKDVAKVEGVLDKGVFTKELEIALLAKEVDVAVHSLKDVPTVLDDEFEIAGALERAPLRDVLVCAQAGGLDALPKGARVGTSSVRRQKQLLYLRPDLELVDIRGNVPTRLEKLIKEDYDAIMLAEAGLVRLGYSIDGELEIPAGVVYPQALDPAEFLPAASQGIVGFEIRSDDEESRKIVEGVTHYESMMQALAEREFLRLIDGGCHTPVGVYTQLIDGQLVMAARVFPDEGNEPPKESKASGPIDQPLVVGGELFAKLA
ncbi:hydroxymethylbilane synthase [Persicirhabdus sediminis]|uniref:Porphobilinogen deaminase n=1 Tax=Persicirhabdus sediminis TaxID=454144 RepID=A0A8J7SL07_9BACT|nr:hydroxymethylbilane synthase [Persicirhabdus sediminis]MBK1790098.1 hydroxymethylbilane synthase [Persicirhabdus sediminis]